jgi:hypothetical protein
LRREGRYKGSLGARGNEDKKPWNGVGIKLSFTLQAHKSRETLLRWNKKMTTHEEPPKKRWFKLMLTFTCSPAIA